jgi:RimJ/RimL family protein N-acetyltransferase
LFTDASFMVFSGDLCDVPSAHARFDRMRHNATNLNFSKRPVIERATDLVLDYCGIAPFSYNGEQRLEFGFRLCSDARGKGYATEAGLALLDDARACSSGVLLAMVDPGNTPSINVINKLGFSFCEQAHIDGFPANIYQLDLA